MLYISYGDLRQFSVSKKPFDVAKSLAAPIFNSGGNITADNRFAVMELVLPKISYVGSLRKNKPEISPEFTTRKRKPQTSLFRFQKNALC